MKTPFVALCGIALAGAAADAQTVNQRRANQDRRIEQGVASGRLTPRETAHVERQQASIAAQEARMRARNGGHLTRYQRARLQHRQDNASRHIYRDKHNRRGR